MDESSDLSRRLESLNDWQIEEIQKGIEEADRGGFARDQEVQQLLKRWKVRARSSKRHD